MSAWVNHNALAMLWPFCFFFVCFLASCQATEASPAIAITTAKEASAEAPSTKPNLTPMQQRVVKQLLQAATAFGRAVSELFVLLVKLSVGSAQRQRRAPHVTTIPVLPPLPARVVALQLSKLLKEALSWKGPVRGYPVPKLRYCENAGSLFHVLIVAKL